MKTVATRDLKDKKWYGEYLQGAKEYLGYLKEIDDLNKKYGIESRTKSNIIAPERTSQIEEEYKRMVKVAAEKYGITDVSKENNFRSLVKDKDEFINSLNEKEEKDLNQEDKNKNRDDNDIIH